MGKVAKVWVGALLTCAGVGLVFVHPAAGLGLSVVAAVATTLMLLMLNSPDARMAQQGACVAVGAAGFLATGSWALGASLTWMFFFMVPNEVVMRHWRDFHDFGPFVGTVGGLVFAGLAWSTGWWLIALVLPLLLGGYATVATLRGRGNGFKTLLGAKLKVGDPVGEVSLPYREREERFDLADHRGGFVLLCFVRGDWCPVCHVMMRIITKEAPTLAKHNVKLFIITPTEGDIDSEFATKLGLEAGLLLDKDSTLARELGLIERQQAGKDVPLPVTVLIDPGGVVKNISRPDDVTAFATEERLLAVLERSAPQPA